MKREREREGEREKERGGERERENTLLDFFLFMNSLSTTSSVQ